MLLIYKDVLFSNTIIGREYVSADGVRKHRRVNGIKGVGFGSVQLDELIFVQSMNGSESGLLDK